MKKLTLALAVALMSTSAMANSPRKVEAPTKVVNTSAAKSASRSASNSTSSVKLERSAPGFAVSGSSGGKGTWHGAAAISTPAGGGAFAFGGTERHQKCIDRAEFVVRIDGKSAGRALYAECDRVYRKILNTPKKP